MNRYLALGLQDMFSLRSVLQMGLIRHVHI